MAWQRCPACSLAALPKMWRRRLTQRCFNRPTSQAVPNSPLSECDISGMRLDRSTGVHKLLFPLLVFSVTRTMKRFELEALPEMNALFSFAQKLCRDAQDSRDLVQDTMLKAYTYFHTFQEGTNCRAWLFQICKNSFINEIRRRQRQPVALDFQAEESGDRVRGGNASFRDFRVNISSRDTGGILTDMLSDEVHVALEALPSDYQTALILCDIENLSYEEIAEFMRTPVGTVRSRIHRGRTLLGGRLKEYARTHGYSRQPS